MSIILQPGSKVVTTEPSEPPLNPPPGPQPTETTIQPATTATPSGGASTPEPFTPEPCQNCYCSQDVDPITKLNVIKCSPVVCNTNCSKVSSSAKTHVTLWFCLWSQKGFLFFSSFSSCWRFQGYEYKTEAVSCCGTCVQKSCILTAPDNKTHVIEVRLFHLSFPC